MIKANVELEKCVAFLNSIGISTVYRQTSQPTLLPGLLIDKGVIYINLGTLQFPGDLLHEAGHIAVVPFDERHTLDEHSIGQRKDHQAEEMMAIAWSYAACVHLGLDPGFVFHDEGYKGGGRYIADNFKNGNYFGLPMLQWKGMALDEKNASAMNVLPYPHMQKWVLD
jgi:hypothetical protein